MPDKLLPKVLFCPSYLRKPNSKEWLYTYAIAVNSNNGTQASGWDGAIPAFRNYTYLTSTGKVSDYNSKKSMVIFFSDAYCPTPESNKMMANGLTLLTTAGSTTSNYSAIQARHNGNANALALDGSVKNLNLAGLKEYRLLRDMRVVQFTGGIYLQSGSFVLVNQ